MNKLLLLLLVTAFLPLKSWAKARTVRVYYVPWSVVTSSAMTADEVRHNAMLTIDITNEDYAELFVRSLAAETMSEGDRRPVADLRLVIDVTTDEGGVVTFAASRFELGGVRSGKKRAIDETFRRRFSALCMETK